MITEAGRMCSFQPSRTVASGMSEDDFKECREIIIKAAMGRQVFRLLVAEVPLASHSVL